MIPLTKRIFLWLDFVHTIQHAQILGPSWSDYSIRTQKIIVIHESLPKNDYLLQPMCGIVTATEERLQKEITGIKNGLISGTLIGDLTEFFNKYKRNEILKLNIAHNEGNFFTSKNHLKELEDNDLIPIKYCDSNGKISSMSNPNGSLNNIAGIFNKNKNILGMMPHPERMADKICSDDSGLPLFLSLLK